MHSFKERLFAYLNTVKNNRYIDNSYEYYVQHKLQQFAEDKYYFFSAPQLDLERFLAVHQKEYEEIINNFKWIYAHVADKESQELLVIIAAYRLLGHRYVKLPYNRALNTALRQAVTQLTEETESIDTTAVDLLRQIYPTDNFSYGLFDLTKAGGKLSFYALGETVYQYFFQRGYEYHSPEKDITVQKGDIVIDCGCCIGDYAMIFGEQTGKGGQVVCIDPVARHLAMTEKNAARNIHLGCLFRLVHAAVWDKEGERLFIDAQGPGTAITNQQSTNTVISKTIDGIVEELQLPKVDFIKMDIEGAELNALRGAEQSIQKYKPVLAISIYHNILDFKTIPEYINSLKLNYTFFIQHHFMNSWETVLYAVHGKNDIISRG